MATSVVVGYYWHIGLQPIRKTVVNTCRPNNLKTPHRSTHPHPQPSWTVPNLGLRLIRRGAPLPRSDLATHTHVPYL